MSVTISSPDIELGRFAYRIDLPMSAERARAVSIGPVARWCRETFGALGEGWTYVRHGDTIRFCFATEDGADAFVKQWGS